MTVWKEKSRKDWRFRFMYQGELYNGRGYNTRREAEAAAAEQRKALKKASASMKQQTATAFSVISAKYLDFSERRHAAGTYKYKAYVLARFLDYLIRHYGDLAIEQITPQIIIDYLATRESNNNYNIHRKDLSALFEYARGVLMINIPNPCTPIEKMPHTPRVKIVPPEDAITRLILAADPETDEQDLFLTVLHTLGRIDEVLRMKWEDVNFDKRVVTLWTRKRKGGQYEADLLPMGEDLHEVLKGRYRARKQEAWVFFNEDTQDRYYHRPKFMRGLCKRAGIPPIGTGHRKVEKGRHKGEVREYPLYYGFHSLRHFMATHLIDVEKTSLKTTQKFLRHRKVSTTDIYVHSIDESQRAAVDQMKGKFTRKKTFSPPGLAPTFYPHNPQGHPRHFHRRLWMQYRFQTVSWCNLHHRVSPSTSGKLGTLRVASLPFLSIFAVLFIDQFPLGRAIDLDAG